MGRKMERPIKQVPFLASALFPCCLRLVAFWAALKPWQNVPSVQLDSLQIKKMSKLATSTVHSFWSRSNSSEHECHGHRPSPLQGWDSSHSGLPKVCPERPPHNHTIPGERQPRHCAFSPSRTSFLFPVLCFKPHGCAVWLSHSWSLSGASRRRLRRYIDICLQPSNQSNSTYILFDVDCRNLVTFTYLEIRPSSGARVATWNLCSEAVSSLRVIQSGHSADH